MTPCEELGYKVGDLFEVVWDDQFSSGAIVVLKEDDGSVTPYFTLLEGGWCRHSGNSAYQNINKIKPYNPLPALPTEDFKINLSNMTDVEKSLAKEWLKKVAESRGIEFTRYTLRGEELIGVINECKYLQVLSISGYNSKKHVPELSLSFTTPEVKGWELSNNKSEKTLQLEQTIDKLQAALEEAEEQLQSIKNN